MGTRTRILIWDLEIDRVATAQAYQQPVYSCDCSYCRNFMTAYHRRSPEVFSILDQLGIDSQKPAEIVEFSTNPDGSHYYGWWYHVNGTILSGGEEHLALTSGVTLLVRDRSDLVMDNFPRPILQIEFFANVPWVLEEPADSR